MELVSPGCVVCGSPVGHAAMCPVPYVLADANRAGLTDIAISDVVDRVFVSVPPVDDAHANALRDVLTTAIGMVLNWGIRQGYRQAAAHATGAVPASEALTAALQRHAPR